MIDECEKDIREAFAAGAVRVSVAFTEGRLATREDSRNPWTGAGLLPHFTPSPRVEAAQEICDTLVRAAHFIDKQQLGSTDDCGFSPFSIDEKPNHGSPDYARDVAFQKITNRVQGT